MSKRNRGARRIDPPSATTVIAEAHAEPSFWKQRRNIYALSVVLLTMSFYRVMIFANNPGPPGSDGGNWLAFSEQLFGSQVKAAESMYFPVTLVLLKALLLVFSPLVALKLLAVAASISIAVPFFYLLRRSCSPVLAASITVCLLMTGYHLEMLSWGGYPQLLATTFLLTSVILLDEGLKSGSRKTLVAAGALAALVAGTHHFSAMMLSGVIALYLPNMAWHHRAELRSFIKRFATFAVAATGFGLLFLPWYIWYLSLLAGSGSLNANGEAFGGMSDVFSFIYAEAPLTWMTLMFGAPLLCLLPLGRPDGMRLRHIGLTMVIGSAAFYVASHEVRTFQLMQLGVLLCLGVFTGKVEDYLRAGTRMRPVMRGFGYATYGLGLAGLLMIFLINGKIRFDQATIRYVAIDSDAKDALDWVRANTPASARFLTGSGESNWVYFGWWVEGYAQRQSYGTVHPDFLAFKEEREQAEVSRRLVDPATPASELRSLLDKHRIDYVFLSKAAGGEFQNLVDKVPVYLSHQNEHFVVLRINRDLERDGEPTLRAE